MWAPPVSGTRSPAVDHNEVNPIRIHPRNISNDIYVLFNVLHPDRILHRQDAGAPGYTRP